MAVAERVTIEQAVKAFTAGDLRQVALDLWETLGYRSDKQLEVPSAPADFIDSLGIADILNVERVALAEWQSAQFLFQLTNDEIPSLGYGQLPLIVGENSYHKGAIESFLFVAIELKDADWTRTRLAQITREMNRAFPMPVIVLFRYGRCVSIAVIDRRVNRRDASKDVIDQRRIAIIKDVTVERPHRAHIEILSDMAMRNIHQKYRPSDFRTLYDSWMSVLSVKELNSKFYGELFTWYCWALKQTTFPQGQTKDRKGQYSVAVIRLLTRMIFVWFVKEKGVVPEELFRLQDLKSLLRESPESHPESSSYYRAILQNLFFATLNTEPTDRRWKSETRTADGKTGMSSHYLVHTVYRYRDLFSDADRAFELFKQVPFLNGGLFECLDREISERDLERTPELKSLVQREGKQQVLRVDGFSDRESVCLSIPNKLFFSAQGETIDLSEELHTKRAKRTANGLIDIFERYKFTIEENTPIEEEVALDPELLGKVFENLLASYNEDTEQTARKQSGSFYTPREVVDYMVDESLISYLEPHLLALRTSDIESDDTDIGEDVRLRQLLAYGTQSHDFTQAEVVRLISAIEQMKVLDPACGSGAFPMGMLQKLVHVLNKLDPDNSHWRAQNRKPLERQLQEAESIPSPTLREMKVEEAQDALDKLDRAFSDKHYADYSRKLFLVEKCLFGVDIQPIAVQIAKLRFFISLVVSQKVDASQEGETDNFNITPLPNLETKLVAANSLVPINRPAQTSLRDNRIDDKEDELRRANERHFAARTTRTKRKWRDNIVTLRDELAELLEQDSLLTKDSAKQLVAWNPFDQNTHAPFFDPEWMFGLVSGFDIVIGNPPYVRHESIKEQKPLFSKTYDCFAGTADLYVYFYERSVKLLKPGGTLALITSNKWYRATYGLKLRQWINVNTLLRRIIDFGDEAIFTALAYPTIVIATRRQHSVLVATSDDLSLALNWQRGMPVERFPEIFNEYSFAVPQSELKSEGWQLESSSGRAILTKLKAVGVPLIQWCNRRIYSGIKTGLNEAFIVSGETKRTLLQGCEQSASLFVPCLRGRDVKRWNVIDADYWLVKIESSENKKHVWSGHALENAWQLFEKAHPTIAAYFGTEAMRKALVARQDQGHFFWELRSCAFWDEFQKPKVFMPSIERNVEYAPVLQEMYGNNKTHFVVTDRWAYLAAVLNSRISWWFTKQIFTTKQGGYYEFIPQFVGQMPIPELQVGQEEVFIAIVNSILSGKNVLMFEQLLNGLVYELFFPEDLHGAAIKLFNVAQNAGVHRLAELAGSELETEAEKLAATIFKNDHPIFRMLFDLQALPVVRIIEGRDR